MLHSVAAPFYIVRMLLMAIQRTPALLRVFRQLSGYLVSASEHSIFAANAALLLLLLHWLPASDSLIVPPATAMVPRWRRECGEQGLAELNAAPYVL